MIASKPSTPPMNSPKRKLPADFGGVIFPKKLRKGKTRDGERGDDEFYFHAPVASGNRCGHDPKNPRLISYVNPHRVDDWDKDDSLDDFGSKRKSHFFYEADAVLDDFYKFPRMMPELGYVRAYTDDSRQRRSDGREAITAVLKYIVHHMCIVTKRLGYASKDGFQYYNIKHIMKKTGLSFDRVKNALKKLRAAKYIERKTRWIRQKKGRFTAVTSITTINTDLLFKRLDLTAQFSTAAKWSLDKLNRYSKEINVQVRQMVTAAMLPGEYTPKPKKNTSTENFEAYPKHHQKHWLLQINYKPHEIQFNRNAGIVQMNAAERNQELSAEQIYTQAFEMLKNS